MGSIFSDCKPQLEEIKINRIRPIYYLGCKSSVVSDIEAAINDVDPTRGRVCDLFSGTGVVGAALSSTRQVTAVDIQEYSRVLSSALLSPHRLNHQEIEVITESIARNKLLAEIVACIYPLVEYEAECINSAISGNPTSLIELLESPPLESCEEMHCENSSSSLTNEKHRVVTMLKARGLWNSPNTTVLRHFGGIYFSFHQSALLDAILTNAYSFTEKHCDTLTAAALSTASVLVNTIGKQFAQPIRPRNKNGTVKSSLAKVVLRDRSIDTMRTYRTWLLQYAAQPESFGDHISMRQDYCAALKQHGKTFSVVYADPPYTRDHYSRFYHVLETMCLRDNPTVSRVVKKGKLELSRGAYRENRHQSPFCIRSTAPNAFDELFKISRLNDLPLVLSYSPHEAGDGTHPRVVSTSQILDIAHSHYKNVQLINVDGVVHNKLNRNDLKLRERDNAEILIKCFR